MARSVLVGSCVIAVAACSSGGGSADSDAPVTASTVATDDAATSDVSTDGGSPADPASDAAVTDGGLPNGASTTVPVTKDIVTRSPAAVDDGVFPEGFTTVSVRITAADGEWCEVCMWLADDGDERSRGLMGVTDLGEPVGMVFRWPTPTTSNFFMFGTPAPLSIAWFAPDGTHVAEVDMRPCLVADSSDCDRYTAGSEYTMAIEMLAGQLDAIGIGPGSRAEVITGTESPTCRIQR